MKSINSWVKACLRISSLILAPLASVNAASNVEEVDNPCIRIFIGYDSRAPIGHHVCEESISEHSSKPINVTPLYLSTLKDILTRKKSPTQLTDFTYSRFLVPYLSDYKGWSIFMDGNDMLVREDIANLWKLRDDKYAIMVVKHPNFEGEHTFMGKSIQTYPMLNWSSMILFNNAKCKKLTTDYVNTADYYDLHQFKWLDSPELIGELPRKWNHLVGYYKPEPEAALIHWTLGAPYQGGEFETAEHAQEWFSLRDKIYKPLYTE